MTSGYSNCPATVSSMPIAMNGGEALAIVRRQRPDLVLLDIMLPGMSGIHRLKQIKETDPTIAFLQGVTIEKEARRAVLRWYRLPRVDGVPVMLVEAVGIEPTSGNPQPQASTSIAGLSYCALALRPSIRQEDRGASLICLAPPLRRRLEPATRV
jgi:CheY-like chemotaxis protein